MCAICNHRPRANGSRYCSNCQARMDKEKRLRSVEKPVKFATYRGYVVGFYRRNDVLVPRLLRRKPEGLPKGKTLDLNRYIEGFTREQVKNLKSAILQLANF